jgi:hypothetical protein
MSSIQFSSLIELEASYLLPLMTRCWLEAEKLLASSPMFVTRRRTMKNSPLACSGLKIPSFVADRSTPSTWNSNLPSRTVEPAGAATLLAAGFTGVVGFSRKDEVGVVELTALSVLLSLLPKEPRAINASTAAPTPRPIFIPLDMPCFAGWPMPGVGGPNGA